jgi:hypothetical protein
MGLAVAGAAGAQHRHHEHKGPPPAPPGLQSLDVYRDGKALHVLTAEQVGAEGGRDSAPRLWHKRSDDGGVSWSARTRVDRPGAVPSGLRPGNDAQVAASGDRIVALWSIAGTGWGGSGPLVSAVSSDGGKTWKAGPAPSDTGSTQGQAFADLLFTSKGLQAVWLDSRDKAQGLRHAVSTDHGGSWSANSTVAAQTCECCWNTLAARGSDVYVLYRSKGPRDMAVAFNPGTGWNRVGPVAAFGWEVKACPETGGGLVAAEAGLLHALAWTGMEGKEGLYYAASKNGGASWSTASRLGTSDAQHSDLAARGSELLAVWDETTPKGSAIFAARSSSGGWSKPARLSSSGANATHPRVVAAADGFVVLWGEAVGKGERVMRQVRLP